MTHHNRRLPVGPALGQMCLMNPQLPPWELSSWFWHACPVFVLGFPTTCFRVLPACLRPLPPDWSTHCSGDPATLVWGTPPTGSRSTKTISRYPPSTGGSFLLVCKFWDASWWHGNLARLFWGFVLFDSRTRKKDLDWTGRVISCRRQVCAKETDFDFSFFQLSR